MNLTKDDLIQKCSFCNGTGWIEDPPNNTGQGNSFGMRRVGIQRKESCSACHQTGQVITETGEAIAQLISVLRRHGRI